MVEPARDEVVCSSCVDQPLSQFSRPCHSCSPLAAEKEVTAVAAAARATPPDRPRPCDVAGPIVYHFKEGSNPWWTAVQVRGSRYAIARLEFKKDGQYVEVNRLEYSYFVADSGMGPGPYSFRVTDVKGQVVEDVGIPFVEAGDAPGAAQLPVCTPRNGSERHGS